MTLSRNQILKLILWMIIMSMQI